MDISEERVNALERRVDRLEVQHNTLQDHATDMLARLANIEGATSEMRWTLRAMLLIGAGVLYRLLSVQGG